MCIQILTNCRLGAEHWPEIREFITQIIELWNKWIRLSCFYNRV